MTAPTTVVRTRLALLLLADALLARVTTEGASICCTRARVSSAVARLEIGAKRAGKTLDQVDRPELLVCSLSDDDPAEAVRTGKALVAYYLGTEPHIMEASGADPDLVKRVQEIVGWPATEADYRKAADIIPDSLVRSLMAVGTSHECREKVAEYIDAGVTCPILFPMMDDIHAVVDAFGGWTP